MAKGPTPKELAFHKALLELSHLCRYQLKEHEIAQIDHLAQSAGYDQAIPAIQIMLTACRPGSRFPSARDFAQAFSPQISDESQADEVAFLICTAISRHGWRWGESYPDNPQSFQQALKDELGELGALIVKRMGGWYQTCMEGQSVTELKTLRAQIRRLALTLMEKSRLGILDQKPQLPAPAATTMIGNGPRTNSLTKADPLALIKSMQKTEEDPK